MTKTLHPCEMDSEVGRDWTTKMKRVIESDTSAAIPYQG